MRIDKGHQDPSRGKRQDEEIEIREWISVLEETLRVCPSDMEESDRLLTEDLKTALGALRGSLGGRNSSNSA